MTDVEFAYYREGIEMDTNWWHPEKLKNSAQIFYKTTDAVDPKNDYGSYKLVNQSDALTAKSMIRYHGHTNSKGLLRFFKIVFNRLQENGIRFESIIDAGCGLGFTTNACQKISGVKTWGIEISKDATEYASRHHPNCQFLNAAVDPNDVADPLIALTKNLSSTLVIASELYPFTRTSDAKVHRDFIEHILKQDNVKHLLLINSTIYLKNIETSETFLSSLSNWKNWGFEVKNDFFPSPKVCRFFSFPINKILVRLFRHFPPIGRGTTLVTLVTKSKSL